MIKANPFNFRMNSDYVKSMVYGGLDGIITTFAVVSGVTGGALDFQIIIVLGFSNLLADGLSMAVGDYLSSKSENEFISKEIEQHQSNFKYDFQSKLNDFKEYYINKGLTETDASLISETLAKYPEVIEQERINMIFGTAETEAHPMFNALITFFSFILFGFIPLIAYVFASFSTFLMENTFIVASILTGLTLFILGAVKSKLTLTKWVRSGMEMLLVGGAAALIAYMIGFILGS
ncbi:VIT1/CCC1 transporter family protein [Aerococcus viridans]|uniref:VIT1/CCC1 transporter family protein n=1 Tax=Aerococcus viridans TaxID=1377 RepID=UPI0028FD5B02|nr:VIT1/CCC1 transporter family protein [Aerococcus viridans]